QRHAPQHVTRIAALVPRIATARDQPLRLVEMDCRHRQAAAPGDLTHGQLRLRFLVFPACHALPLTSSKVEVLHSFAPNHKGACMTDLNIVLIYGSTREGRFCDTVARWSAAQLLRQEGIRLDIIDPAQIALPMRLERQCSPALVELKTRIGAADAYVVVT